MRRLAVLLLVSTPAVAGTVLSIDALEVNGLQVRSLECELGKGGFFALTSIVSAISERKADLDACAPQGAAFRTRWTWAATGRTASVEAGATPEQATCAAAALGRVEAPFDGACSAVLLVGDPTAAGRAAASLPAPAPAAPSPAPVAEPAPAAP